MSDEMYLLWLSTHYSMGSRKLNKLWGQFGTARALFEAPESLLRTTPGLTERNINNLTNGRDKAQLDDLCRKLEAQKIRFISREHRDFPALLREIPDPPIGLYCLGELPDDALPKVSIIGARRCSEYGLLSARVISKPLAQRGVVVVSGMARGIDSMAHRGALEGGGLTVAVLGCGVDICYPPENRSLREEIINNGCLLSEYPPGVTPLPAYFPARNRIISGLCSITIVVEAAKKSGTLITVDQAHDQGREVMAVPGSILSRLSEGTNMLIAEGATPVTGYADVLHLLRIPDEPPADTPAAKPDNRLAPAEKLVYDSLTFEPITFDELVSKTNSQTQTLHYTLTLLELKGFIKKLPGTRYIRNV